MASSKHRTLVIWILLILLLTANDSLGQSREKTKSIFGIKIGNIFENDFKLSPLKNGSTSYSYYTKESSLGGGVFLDMPIGQRFYGGFSLEIQTVKFAYYSKYWKLLEFGANFKIKIPVPHNSFIFRPGLGLAFGIMSDAPVLENSRFLIGKAFLESVIMAGKKFGFLFDIGLWSVLKGGNDDYNITMGPTLMFRLGLQF